MMMAWKVSGLSHRPAIIASRPTSRAWRWRSRPRAREAPPSPFRADTCAPDHPCARSAPGLRTWPGPSAAPRPARPPTSLPALRLLVGLLALFLAHFARLLGLDHVDAHLAEHGEHILDLLGIDLPGRQHRVDLVMGDVAAFLGGADELLDRGVGEVEQRAVRQSLETLLLGYLFLLRRLLDLACHEPSQPALSPRRIAVLPRSR